MEIIMSWTPAPQKRVQIGLVARELGLLHLQQLAFDRTRIRAGNRPGGFGCG